MAFVSYTWGMAKNIRDMLRGPAHPDEAYTVASFLAETHDEYVAHEDPHAAWRGTMPGDPEHPLARTARNPIPGVGPQALARALRENSIKDPGLRQRVASYLNMVEKFADFSTTRGDGYGSQSLYDRNMQTEGESIVNPSQSIRRCGW